MENDGTVKLLQQMTERRYSKLTAQSVRKTKNKLAASYLEKETLHVSFFYFFLTPKFYIQSRLYSYVSSFLASNYFIFQKCCNKNTYTIYRSYLLPAYYEFFDQFRMQAKRSWVLTDSRLYLQLRNSKH